MKHILVIASKIITLKRLSHWTTAKEYYTGIESSQAYLLQIPSPNKWNWKINRWRHLPKFNVDHCHKEAPRDFGRSTGRKASKIWISYFLATFPHEVTKLNHTPTFNAQLTIFIAKTTTKTTTTTKKPQQKHKNKTDWGKIEPEIHNFWCIMWHADRPGLYVKRSWIYIIILFPEILVTLLS